MQPSKFYTVPKYFQSTSVIVGMRISKRSTYSTLASTVAALPYP